MDRYIPDMQGTAGFSIDESVFRDVEIMGALDYIRRTSKPQVFGIDIGGSVPGTPLLHGGVVYFGACDKNFYAVDAETGKEIWRFATNAPIYSSASVYEGAIYFGSYDNSLYALSLDGKLLWKFSTSDKIAATPCAHNGVIYIGSKDGNLYALGADTGGLLWKFTTNGPISSTVVVHGDRIYFGSWDNCLYVLSMDGSLIWKFATRGEITSTPVFFRDIVLFGSCDGNFHALSASDGSELWKFATGGSIFGRAYMEGEAICIGSLDGNAYGLDMAGKCLWKLSVKDPISSRMSGENGTIYFGSWGNNFYAADMKTGRMKWRFGTSGIIMPKENCVWKGMIYIGSYDCNAYALTADGKMKWKFHTALSFQSPIRIEEKDAYAALEVTWRPEEDAKKGGLGAEEAFSDYGEFSGSYMKKDKTDYVSSGKRSYVRKKDL